MTRESGAVAPWPSRRGDVRRGEAERDDLHCPERGALPCTITFTWRPLSHSLHPRSDGPSPSRRCSRSNPALSLAFPPSSPPRLPNDADSLRAPSPSTGQPTFLTLPPAFEGSFPRKTSLLLSRSRPLDRAQRATPPLPRVHQGKRRALVQVAWRANGAHSPSSRCRRRD